MFRYTLSKKATVRIAMARRRAGRRSGTSCVAPTPRRRKAPKCTRFTVLGTLTRASHQGSNVVFFSGRVGSKALVRGRYEATLTATDGAGNVSRAKILLFRVVGG